MRKTIVILLALVLLLTSSGMTVFAAQPDRTYTYEENNPVPSTNVFQVRNVVDETVMGTTRMKAPTDIFVDNNDMIYILDAGNKRILILDKNYRCVKELQDFNYNGETLNLEVGAQGLFYREENQRLYIADTENNRILVSDLDGNVSKVFEKPVDELLNPEEAFKPRKIIVDNMGIMYVTSVNINTGAMLIDSAGSFLGFYGTNKLKETAAMKVERMWRKLMKQAETGVTFQPVEFNNLFWSEDRFVYTVSPLVDTVESSVSKLNALGNNVFPNMIDLYTLTEARAIEGTVLADITVDNEGAVTIVDLASGHLFQYDEGCNLLAVFGGIGYQQGLFMQPVSIESDSENALLVLDSGKNTVTVMEQTYYGKMIRSANYLYNQGLYQESIEPWKEVLRMNANYTQAYAGLGKAYVSLGEYEQAMEYFKMGKDQAGYAEAKAALRDEKIRENFGLVAAIVILLLIFALGYEKIFDVAERLYWRIRK